MGAICVRFVEEKICSQKALFAGNRYNWVYIITVWDSNSCIGEHCTLQWDAAICSDDVTNQNFRLRSIGEEENDLQTLWINLFFIWNDDKTVVHYLSNVIRNSNPSQWHSASNACEHLQRDHLFLWKFQDVTLHDYVPKCSQRSNFDIAISILGKMERYRTLSCSSFVPPEATTTFVATGPGLECRKILFQHFFILNYSFLAAKVDLWSLRPKFL